MEIAPRHQEREHLRLPGTRGHLYHEARPSLIEHACGNGTGSVKAHQVEFVACAADLIEPNDGLDGFPLREVVAKRTLRAVGLLDQVLRCEPPRQQSARTGR